MGRGVRRYRRWTAADACNLIAWRRRYTVATIARRLGRTERAVVAYSYAHRCYPWDGSWYTPIEVARLLGVTRQCVTGWCARGVLRAQRVPGSRRWLIAPGSVEALVRLRRPDVWQRWKERHDE